jgi:hypothetical protein
MNIMSPDQTWLWPRKHYLRWLFEDCWGIRIVNRLNTRRNRKCAKARWWNREEERYTKEPPHWSANENQARCAAHLADFIQSGGTIKAYSAWSGAGVRHLSKLLDDFRRQRLPGQRQLTINSQPTTIN